MPPVFYLEIKHIQKLSHTIAKTFLDIDTEPIPPYETVKINLLDSALARPKATYDGKELYPTICEKGVALLYSMVKNHPFENGNKRIATASLLVFLYMNGHWFDLEKMTHNELADTVLKLANSPSRQQEAIHEDTCLWLKDKIVEIPETNDHFDFVRKIFGLFRR